jgi:hypothetical protein
MEEGKYSVLYGTGRVIVEDRTRDGDEWLINNKVYNKIMVCALAIDA